MVLETLIKPYEAEINPKKIFIHGLIYGIVGILLAWWVFPQYASIVSVFFISAASIPFLYTLIKYEEEKDVQLPQQTLWKEHSKAIQVYLWLFFGIMMAYTLFFLFTPEIYLQTLFEAQIDTYAQINPNKTITGQMTGGDWFQKIFFNNLRVLILCVLFSFLYGAGAIFILTWNASVIALAIGNTVRTQLGAITGVETVTQYFALSAYTILLRYGLHGILEILAYLLAGLAGGIISVGVLRNHFSSDKYSVLVMDITKLLLLAVLLLLLGAIIEVWITPYFYL